MNIYLKIKKNSIGRVGRKAFFLPGLTCISFMHILLSFSAFFFVFSQGNYLNMTISLLLLLLVLFFFSPEIIKRFHDLRLSGWFCLLIFVPPLFSTSTYLLDTLYYYQIWEPLSQNLLFLFLYKSIPILHILTILFIFLMPGQKNKNKYGEVPVYRKNKWRILGWILFVILFFLSSFMRLISSV